MNVFFIIDIGLSFTNNLKIKFKTEEKVDDLFSKRNHIGQGVTEAEYTPS